MRQSQMTALLGLIVFIAIMIFIVAVMWLSQSSITKTEGFTFEVLFDSVHGLKKGDPVTVAGVKAGQVKAIDLSGGGAVVTIQLEKNIFLPKDSKAYLTTAGVMGDRVINLVKGDSHEALKTTEVLVGETVGGMQDIIKITDDLKSVLEEVTNEENTKNFSESLRNLNESLQGFNMILAENKEDLRKTIDNLESGSKNVSDLVDENDEDVGQIVQNIKANSAKLDTISTELTRAVTDLNSILYKINNGNGSVARFLNEDSLYVDVRKTVTNADTLIFSLESLVEDIKKNPRKYINLKFSLF
jgi:phospholipid/cholesterol/gamma-HCH transport system substrate-binding protein